MKKNKIIAVIPARYEASRFPGKLMQLLGEKTVITTTYQNVVDTMNNDTNSKTVENQRFVQLFSPLLKQPRTEVWNGSD